MDVINKDILYVIFGKLSSYKRSKVCTVCKLWNDMGLQCISLIEPVTSRTTMEMFKCDFYHRLVRFVIKNTYGSSTDGILGTINLLEKYVFHNGKTHFAKLYFMIRSGKIWWDEEYIYEHVIGKGYEKAFYWIRRNHTNKWLLSDSDYSNYITDVFDRMSLHLACNIGKPDLITVDNIPTGLSELADAVLRSSASDKVINKLLSFGNYTVCDIFVWILNDQRREKDLFYRLVASIKADIQEFMDDEIDYTLFDDTSIALWRTGDIEAIYEHNTYQPDGTSMFIYYGIMISGYNESVIKTFCTPGGYWCGWELSDLLSIAYTRRHRRMADCMLQYMVEDYMVWCN